MHRIASEIQGPVIAGLARPQSGRSESVLIFLARFNAASIVQIMWSNTSRIEINAKTASQKGLIIPVVITVFADRSYTFITKTPPASILLLKAAGVQKGSGTPNKDKVGKVTRQQVEEIARTKMPDLNAADVPAAVKIVEGTARSMGIEVV